MREGIWKPSGENVKIHEEGENLIIEFSNGSCITTTRDNQDVEYQK